MSLVTFVAGGWGPDPSSLRFLPSGVLIIFFCETGLLLLDSDSSFGCFAREAPSLRFLPSFGATGNEARLGVSGLVVTSHVVFLLVSLVAMNTPDPRLAISLTQSGMTLVILACPTILSMGSTCSCWTQIPQRSMVRPEPPCHRKVCCHRPTRRYAYGQCP